MIFYNVKLNSYLCYVPKSFEMLIIYILSTTQIYKDAGQFRFLAGFHFKLH